MFIKILTKKYLQILISGIPMYVRSWLQIIFLFLEFYEKTVPVPVFAIFLEKVIFDIFFEKMIFYKKAVPVPLFAIFLEKVIFIFFILIGKMIFYKKTVPVPLFAIFFGKSGTIPE